MNLTQTIGASFALLVTAVAVTMVTRTAVRMVRIVRSGAADHSRTGHPVQRSVTMARETLGHTRMLKWSIPGAAHWFVFVAFGVLFFTLAEAYGEMFDPDFGLPFVDGWAPYGLLTEAIAAVGGLGILALIAIRLLNLPRWRGRSSRFSGSVMWQAYYVEWTIVGVIACVFAIRATKENIGSFHYPYWATPISHELANIAPNSPTAVSVVAVIKVLISMAWFMVIAQTITMGVAWHRFTAFFNIWFKRNADGTVALGALKPAMSQGKPLDFAAADPENDTFGVGQIGDFSWKGLLDFTTCTECGRCQSQCPAWNTEKPLSPKLLVTALRSHAYASAPYMLAGGRRDVMGEELGDPAAIDLVDRDVLAEAGRPLVGTAAEGGVIDPDVLWSCTTCGACVEQCPVDIEHVDHIVDMRRYQVMIESKFPSEAGSMLRNLENKGNPWGNPASAREDWAAGLDFEITRVKPGQPIGADTEYLFWVGCAGALDDRARKTTRAVAELLHTAGVKFAILGKRETCTGDPARRIGNEFVYQTLAQTNVETLNEVFAERSEKVERKVVATCPHCFNTLANEYPDLGGDYTIVHHTQLLERLVKEKRLVPTQPLDTNVTYHDPCYLGRHNRIFAPPRELLATTPGTTLTEMPRNSEKSFCCGAGGARMWMEEKIGKQINLARTDEALETKPDAVVAACPFCLTMLSDGVNSRQAEGEKDDKQVEVLDIARLLHRSVIPPKEQPPTVTDGGPEEAS